MQHLRLATGEEIEKIAEGSDLSPGCVVYALDSKKGPTIAVVRNCYEVDPVYFAEGFSRGEKTKFFWGLEERMLEKLIPAYYFNVSASDEMKEWRDTVESWGAEKISATEEYRYKRLLVK